MPPPQVELSELKRIPYLRADCLAGRALPTLGFYTKEYGYQLWMSHDGKLRALKGEPGEADFFAEEAQSENDLALYFMNVLGKRLLFPRLIPTFRALRHDIHNLSASLAKIDHFAKQQCANPSTLVSRFVETELEYILIVCRSMFDLFHGFFSRIWASVELRGHHPTPTPSLPQSFASLLLRHQKPRSPEELQERYNIPTPIALSLVACGPFFLTIRQLRDHIVHHGHSLDLVLGTPRGFAVRAARPPLEDLQIWRADDFLPNDLAPMRPLLTYFVRQTFAAFDSVISAFGSCIQLPEDPLPQFQLFNRGWYGSTMAKYLRLRRDEHWWQ